MTQVAGQDVDKLSNLIMQSMDQDGALGQIKAQIRSNVYKIMQNQDQKTKKSSGFQLENPISKKIASIPEGLNTIELIAEFLSFFQMEYTLSVFSQESNVPANQDLRQKLARKMNLQTSTQRPLLIDIIEGYFGGKTGQKTETPSQEIKRPVTAQPMKAEPVKKEDMKKQLEKKIEHKQEPKFEQPKEQPKYEEKKETTKFEQKNNDTQNNTKQSLLGPLPGFKSNIGTKGSLTPLGGMGKNSSESAYLGGSQKKDPYAFDMDEPSQPAKKQNNFVQKETPKQEKPAFNKTQTFQKPQDASVSEDIDEEIYDETYEQESDQLASSNYNKQVRFLFQSLSNSHNQMISQSQAMDITVDSNALEEYDYYEQVRE